jgi:hypothetical protein
MSFRTAALLAAAGLALTTPASAQTSPIRLFGGAGQGMTYSVQRFNYQLLAWPSPLPPPDRVQLISTEGIAVLGKATDGSTRVVISSDDVGAVYVGTPENVVIEARFPPAGRLVGAPIVTRVLIEQDPASIAPQFQWDLNPGGLTVNPTSSGIGRGGNLVVAGANETMHAYSLTNGQLLSPTTNVPCVTPADQQQCRFDLAPSNPDCEDVVFVPAFGAEPDLLYTVDQLGPYQVEKFQLDGTNVGNFNIGNWATGGPTVNSEPKGITFVPRSGSVIPPALRRPGGVVIVSIDDTNPGLQVMTRDGTQVLFESLTADGLPTGASRLNLGTDPNDPPFPSDLIPAFECTRPLQLESLTIDPETGRLFLNNQGEGFACNYIWVLTPCLADFNADLARSPADIFAFLNTYFAQGPGSDFNDDNQRTPADIFAFLNAYFAGC